MWVFNRVGVQRIRISTPIYRESRSLWNVKIAIGIEVTNNSKSDANAACVKNASDADPHIVVASVLNPSGPRIKVAGSSFIVRRNTSTPPANVPRQMSGNVIKRKTCVRFFPSPRAASSNFGLTDSRVDFVAPIAAGRKSTVYAKSSNTAVW